MAKEQKGANKGGTLSDAELLVLLRDGDFSAFEVLWSRHIEAALRLAYRLTPNRAEDLASESFLILFKQVTTTSSGPTSSFRAYLFTVMRNLAMKWSREDSSVDISAEIEEVNQLDALVLIEDSEGAAKLLAAFQELPERWQRALWLSEVEGVSRKEIAKAFNMRGNAVSALLGRARAGLRKQWILQHIPPELSNDLEHVARLFPQYLLDVKDTEVITIVEEHLPKCQKCSDLHVDLSSASRRLHGTSLSVVGFAALGTVLPAATAKTVGAAGTGAMLFGVGGVLASAGSAAGVAGILAICGFLAVNIFTNASNESKEGTRDTYSVSSDAGSSSSERYLLVRDRASHGDTRQQQDAEARTDIETEQLRAGLPIGNETGRGVIDDSIPELDFGLIRNYAAPALASPPTETDAEDLPVLDPDANSALRPGITSPTEYHGYFPPVIHGVTEQNAQVVVQINDKHYIAQVAEDGSWDFDLRFRDSVPDQEYRYSVVAVTDTETSPVVDGSYTVEPIQVDGFEDLSPLDISEAETTGIVMKLTGPANGTVCVDTMAGHYAEVPLDANGSSTQRVRMHSRGFYMFNWRLCDGGYRGALVETYVQVDDPEIFFDPWGPDPAEMTFDFSNPEQ